MTIAIDLTVPRGTFALQARFTAPPRGVTAVYGPSGAGKTTLLRAMAGLQPAQGELRVGEVIWQSDSVVVPAHRRELGMVFQEPSLFTHLSVEDNLRFGQRYLPPGKQPADYREIVTLLGLEGLLERRVDRLSGGESQRVALGRALLRSPRILLLDEPLTALDRARKRELLGYLGALPQALDLPLLYVSHALDEVVGLADHLVLLNEGRTIAAGPVNDLLTQLDLPPAQDADAAAVITGETVGYDSADQLSRIRFDGGELLATSSTALPNGPVKLRILARDVSLTLDHQQHTSILNIVPATVTDLRAAEAGQCTVRLDCGGQGLLARVSRRSVSELELQPGRPVFAQIKAVALLQP